VDVVRVGIIPDVVVIVVIDSSGDSVIVVVLVLIVRVVVVKMLVLVGPGRTLIVSPLTSMNVQPYKQYSKLTRLIGIIVGMVQLKQGGTGKGKMVGLKLVKLVIAVVVIVLLIELELVVLMILVVILLIILELELIELVMLLIVLELVMLLIVLEFVLLPCASIDEILVVIMIMRCDIFIFDVSIDACFP
jgi:hypothetical protein